MKLPSDELVELLGKLANVELYAIFMAPTEKFQGPSTPEGDKLLADHLSFCSPCRTRTLYSPQDRSTTTRIA